MALDRNVGVTLKGLYAHCGNSYSAKNVEEVGRLRDEAISELVNLSDKLTSETGENSFSKPCGHGNLD